MTLINVRFTPCNMSAIVSDSVTEQKTIFGQSLTDFAGGKKKKLLEADRCLSGHCSTLPLLQVKQVWRENKKGRT